MLARWIGAGAVALLAGGLAACAPGADGAPAPSDAAEGFILDEDFPDPDILAADGRFYAFATNTPAANVQFATSDDAQEWSLVREDALPDLPEWASGGRTWAPDVSANPAGGYIMYFVAAHTASDKQCIGVATATTPEGPYVPAAGDPIICTLDEGGAIDPATFTDDDGTRYLVWKNDGNCCAMDTWIQLAPLSADGLTLAGPTVRLFKQTEEWEGNLVEAPVLVKHGDAYVVFYSANDYGSDAYAIGVASAPALAGPWTKQPGPLLSTESSDGRFYGPGGQDVVTTAEGDVMFFHSWDENVIYRGMNSAPLLWDGDIPMFGRASVP